MFLITKHNRVDSSTIVGFVFCFIILNFVNQCPVHSSSSWSRSEQTDSVSWIESSSDISLILEHILPYDMETCLSKNLQSRVYYFFLNFRYKQKALKHCVIALYLFYRLRILQLFMLLGGAIGELWVTIWLLLWNFNISLFTLVLYYAPHPRRLALGSFVGWRK